MVAAATYLNPPFPILSQEDVGALITAYKNELLGLDGILRVAENSPYFVRKSDLYDALYLLLDEGIRSGRIPQPLSLKDQIGHTDYYRYRHDAYPRESASYFEHIESLLTRLSPCDPRFANFPLPHLREALASLHVTAPLPYLLEYGNSNLAKFSSLGAGGTHHQRRLSPIGTLWRNFTLQALHSTFEELIARDPAAYMMMVALEPEVLHAYAFDSHFVSYKRSGLQETNVGVAWTALFTAGRDLLNPRGMLQTAQMMFDMVANGRIVGMTLNAVLHNPPVDWKDFKEFLCITLGPVLMSAQTCAVRENPMKIKAFRDHVEIIETFLTEAARLDQDPDLDTPEKIRARAMMMCTFASPDGRPIGVDIDGEQYITRPPDISIEAMADYVTEVLMVYARETGVREVIRGYDIHPDDRPNLLTRPWGDQPGLYELRSAINAALQEARELVGRYPEDTVYPKEIRPYRTHLGDAVRAVGRVAAGVLEALQWPLANHVGALYSRARDPEEDRQRS